MDNKTLTKIDDSFQDHKRTVINRIAYGAPSQKLQEALEQHFNEMVKQIERNLNSSELLTNSTYEFLHSEAPVAFHELKHFREGHADPAIEAFTAAINKAHDSTMYLFSEEGATKEEQSDEVSSINNKKRSTIEEQKEDDQKRNKTQTRNQIHDRLSDFIVSVQQVAVRNILARDISERLNYFKALSNRLLEDATETLGADFDTHTKEIYTVIENELEKQESELYQITGLNELNRQTTQEQQGQEPVFTQELLDAFKTGNVDTSKLSPQECKWYLDFLFDEPLPEIAQTNNRDAFNNTTVEEIDSLPTSILGDVSPELQPLSPEVLAEYNKNVAASRKQAEDEKKPNNDDKEIDSLPDLFL